jgi:hypothetical protein
MCALFLLADWVPSSRYRESCRSNITFLKQDHFQPRSTSQAAGYGNEKAVGRAVRDSDIPRSDIFVTTKLGFDGHDDVEGHFKKSFDALDIEYIDLFVSRARVMSLKSLGLIDMLCLVCYS